MYNKEKPRQMKTNPERSYNATTLQNRTRRTRYSGYKRRIVKVIKIEGIQIKPQIMNEGAIINKCMCVYAWCFTEDMDDIQVALGMLCTR